MAASADPDLLVKELARLEAQIVAHARPVSLQEAISTGIRANPALMQTFSTIQQYEWQLIAAQRQWFPTLQLNNGTPVRRCSVDFVHAELSADLTDRTARLFQHHQSVGLSTRGHDQLERHRSNPPA